MVGSTASPSDVPAARQGGIPAAREIATELGCEAAQLHPKQ